MDSAIQLFKITKPSLHADWSRAMFNKSEDHGNDVMVAQLFFSFLCVCDLLRTVNGNGHQNCQCYFKKQFDNNFLIDDRNDVKKFKILQCNH